MTDIRFALPADLPVIMDMVRALSAFHGDEAKVTDGQLHDMFFGPAPMATALIAWHGSTPVGYAGLTPTMVIHDGRIRMDIHHLFVRENLRKQGIGKALIAVARDHAISLGATRVTIGTDPDNATSIAAYRAMDNLTEVTGFGPRFWVDLDG